MNILTPQSFGEEQLVLIDTWWNVNSGFSSDASTVILVLIDTWWNVNDERLTKRVYTLDVLIDTWWNVNYIQQSKILNPNKVLIDTWWNVNSFEAEIISVSKCRFNRYMVECELIRI